MHIAVFIRRNETAELVFVYENNSKIKCLTQLNNNKDRIMHTEMYRENEGERVREKQNEERKQQKKN